MGMNFSLRSSLIFSKVMSAWAGLAHFISHPSANDFPCPWSILFRNARILFFGLSLYIPRFRVK